MKPLFPSWSNTASYVVLTTLGVSVVAVPAAAMIWVRTPYVTKEESAVDQPVQFDHRHHVRDDGIDCLYCHYEATRSSYAGVPPTAVCMNCHGQVWSDSARLKPVRDSYFSGEPLRWERVHQLPDFVYFNHSAHVSHGVGCKSCHGRVDLMASVYPVAPLTMRWCLDCHRNPDAELRPLDRVTDMEWVPREPQAELGARIRSELHVAPPVNCTTCHR